VTLLDAIRCAASLAAGLAAGWILRGLVSAFERMVAEVERDAMKEGGPSA
jgi:hypothetical protein